MKRHPGFLAFLTLLLVVIGSVCLSGCEPSSQKPDTPQVQKSKAMDAGMNMDKSGAVGFMMVGDSSGLKAGGNSSLKFKLTDVASGATLTKLETTHGKLLHFMVVDESLVDFQHLHPLMANDGTWTQNVTFPSGGRYLLFADGKVGTSGFVARQEVKVAGAPRTGTMDFAISKTRKVGEISATIVDPSDFSTGGESMVRLKLSRPDGWQPYLEAPGHLILIRKEGDEFIHAHPAQDMKDGVVEFMANFKKHGVYRAWAQFQREDKVLTFPFTVEVSGKDTPNMGSMNMDHPGH